MTNDKTTREVSQRLMDVGFDETRESVWYKGKIVSVEALMEYALEVDVDFTEVYPAYSASTLLTWINENHKKYNFEWSLDDDGIFVYIVGTIQGEGEYSAEFNGSWPDLFAEAIIWIKEKENK